MKQNKDKNVSETWLYSLSEEWKVRAVVRLFFIGSQEEASEMLP